MSSKVRRVLTSIGSKANFIRRSDFWEDRNGNCRIGSSLAIKLCETSDTWRKLVAPIAEHVAQELWSSVSRPASPSKVTQRLIATRLTQRKKREVKGSNVPEVKQPKPEHVCGGCGKPIMAERNHCANCAVDGATERLVNAAQIGRVAARSPEARAKHVASRRRHAQACRNGTNRRSQLGSQAKCFCKKSSRFSRALRHPPFDHGLEFPGGTRAGFAKATARIHAIGRLLRNWWVFRSIQIGPLDWNSLRHDHTRCSREATMPSTFARSCGISSIRKMTNLRCDVTPLNASFAC